VEEQAFQRCGRGNGVRVRVVVADNEDTPPLAHQGDESMCRVVHLGFLVLRLPLSR
jgi:hypothetical protein